MDRDLFRGDAPARGLGLLLRAVGLIGWKSGSGREPEQSIRRSATGARAARRAGSLGPT
jgi:hypothetical protein